MLAIAVALCAASYSFATVKIQAEAKAKDPKVTCKTCHTATPCTKTNLTDEGKKWVKK
jgi:hypothetical protein